MSVRLTGAVWHRGPKSETLRSTLAVITDEADDYGFAACSLELIAAKCSRDERTIIRRIAELEKQGWIQVRRKVLQHGRGNVYFVSLEKLGLEVHPNGRRSPLWADMERLLRALDSGDKLSRRNGVLRFERPAKDAGKVESGDLFNDQNPGDKVSPENAANLPQIEPETLQIAASAAVCEEKPVDAAAEGPIPGDSLSHDTRHSCHVTGDNGGVPFNSFNPVTTPLEKTTPAPPEGAGLVLPVEECLWGEPLFAECLGLAGLWLTRQIGVSEAWLRQRIEKALAERCRMNREGIRAVATMALNNWWAYQNLAADGLLKFQYGAPAFWGHGHWQFPATWPFNEEKARGVREARVGMR